MSYIRIPDDATVDDFVQKPKGGKDRARGSSNVWPAAPLGYEIKETGVYKTGAKEENKFRVCLRPAWVSARGRNSQNQNAWGRLIEWIDEDGNHHSESVPGSAFHNGANELAKDLEDRGLPIVVGKTTQFLQYLQSFNPRERYQVTSKLGWFDDDTRLAFMISEECITGQTVGEERIVFQADHYSPSRASMKQSGSLEDWQDNVYSVCEPHPFLTFPIFAAFTAPLLKLVVQDSFAFHFFGDSTHGKTTQLQTGATVWGCGADPAIMPERSFVQSWSTTSGAFEGLAVAHTDLFLALDELHKCTAQNFTSTIYTLFGGQGKNALSRNRSLREKRTWRLVGCSSGEMSMREKIEKEDGSAKTGELVRVVDIRVPSKTGVLKFNSEKPMSGAQSKNLVDSIKMNCAKYYGVAGPEFIRRLIKKYKTFIALKEAANQRFIEGQKLIAGESKVPIEQLRVNARFALVYAAAALAREVGVLPETAQVADIVLEMFEAWKPQAALLTDTNRGVIAVRDFISKHWQSRFVPLKSDADGDNKTEDSKTRSNLVGYVDRDQFLFTPAGFREACGTADPRSVANALKELGLLVHESGRNQCQRWINGVGERVYIVKKTILGNSKNEDTNQEEQAQ